MNDGKRASDSMSSRYSSSAPEDRAAERRPEDRADPGRHADRDGDPGVPRLEIEETAEERPEARADLGGGPLTPAGTTRADRDRGCDELDQRDPGPDAAWVVVERPDRGVRPVPFGFGREAEHDDPRDQPAQPDDERDRPGPQRVGDRGSPLAGRRRGRVAGKDAQEEMGRARPGRCRR